jgi:hypothetical protein
MKCFGVSNFNASQPLPPSMVQVGKRAAVDKDPTFPHIGTVLRGVTEGSGWKLTIKMMTFDDIENVVYTGWEGASRDGGGVEGRKWAKLVPCIEAAVDDIRAPGR